MTRTAEETTAGRADEELLPLSGIQHFAFCERQWALIQIECQWAEDVRTTEGHLLHARVDDPFFDESRGNRRIARAVPLLSHRLGLQGVADVVEFNRDDRLPEGLGVVLPGSPGRWRPRPVEYKRGHPKPDERDAVQLCAQGMALEEMLGVTIPAGDLYYHQTRRREPVELTPALRARTVDLAQRMHRLFAAGVTPAADPKPHCSNCSLERICMPELARRRNQVAAYLKRMEEG